MRKDKEKAVQLRRQGKSYKEISRDLGIAPSTLSSWFKRLSWSGEIKSRLSSQVSWKNPRALELLAQANRQRWQLKHAEYRDAAVREFNKLKHDPLFLAGIMLYWGEGDKRPQSCIVKLSSNEPEMIKIFYLFLTKKIGVSEERISGWLLLYPDLIESVQKNFWSKTTGLPLNRFKRSAYIKGRHPNKRLSFGVCNIVINSRALKERIMKWLELYQNHLLSHALRNDLK